MKPTKGNYISQIANKKKSLIKMFYSLENDSIIEKTIIMNINPPLFLLITILFHTTYSILVKTLDQKK